MAYVPDDELTSLASVALQDCFRAEIIDSMNRHLAALNGMDQTELGNRLQSLVSVWPEPLVDPCQLKIEVRRIGQPIQTCTTILEAFQSIEQGGDPSIWISGVEYFTVIKGDWWYTQ